MIKLTHVSNDNNIKAFVPRIPKYRVLGENGTLPRICTSTNVLGCIKAFPYRSDLVKKASAKHIGAYLVIYEFYERKKNTLSPKDVYSLGVSDAIENQEYWIVKGSRPYRKQIIRVTDFKLSKYNKYTWEYYGDVVKLDYQNSIEGYLRILEDTIYEYRYYQKLKRLFEKLGVEILSESIEEYYFGYGYSSDAYDYPRNMSNTKKKVVNVKYKVPAGVDLYYIWDLILKDNNKFDKKTISLLSDKFLKLTKNL